MYPTIPQTYFTILYIKLLYSTVGIRNILATQKYHIKFNSYTQSIILLFSRTEFHGVYVDLLSSFLINFYREFREPLGKKVQRSICRST